MVFNFIRGGAGINVLARHVGAKVSVIDIGVDYDFKEMEGLTIRKAMTDGCSKKDVNFYNGKLITMKYFFEYEVPKTAGLAERLVKCDGLTVDMDSKMFSD